MYLIWALMMFTQTFKGIQHRSIINSYLTTMFDFLKIIFKPHYKQLVKKLNAVQ